MTPTPEEISKNEKLAANFRNELRKTDDGKPEGTLESLLRCANMLDTYAPDCFPANELGQVDFARAMMEGVADEIRAFVQNQEASLRAAEARGEQRGRIAGLKEAARLGFITGATGEILFARIAELEAAK